MTTNVKSIRETVPAARIRAAADLTTLLNKHETFSFIRLGDGECWWLYNVQDGRPPPKYRYTDGRATNVEQASSTSGLEPRHYERFKRALEQSTFLDYCNNIPVVEDYLPTLRFRRPADALRNETAQTSNIIFEWTYLELATYLRGHRCLIASAEAALLEALLQSSRYRELARDFIPDDVSLYFHQVRENGRNYWENLDLIMEDLVREVEEHGIDTVFVSLATGAKIVCHELAERLAIRAIDFGSMTRALTYSGSPGYQTNRNLHNPFMFRVPFSVYMDALVCAHPDWDEATVLSKAHSQMLLDLQDLKPFRFNKTDAATGQLDLSTENLRMLKDNLRDYHSRFASVIEHDEHTRGLHDGFVYWMRKQGIGFDGKVFLFLVRCKAVLRRMLASVGIRI